MAGRRMLWKEACQSKKLSKVSLPAALLWTWAIPWFDRDGYLEGDPYFLKLNVVPNRRELDEDSMQPLIDELVEVGLWITFEDEEGKTIIKDPRFNEFQHIEYNKESKSRWEGKKLNSTSTRRVSDEYASRREVKLREDKLSKKAQPDPVDNSDLEYEDNRPSAALVEILKQKHPNLNPFAYYNKFKKRFTEKVIIESLMEIAKSKTIKDPYAWAEGTLPSWNRNYNEREFIKKQDLVDYGAIVDDLKKLKEGK